MKITSVRAFLLSYPLPQPLKLAFFGGERTIVKRDAMLIRVAADNGLVGYAPGQGSENAQRAITETIAAFLEGRTLADPDALRILFLHGPGRRPELARLYCSVEIALFDLIGKAMDLPVSELLGGRVRDSMRLYGSAGMYMQPEKYAEEAAAIAAMGFPAYKMRPALGPDGDLETVRRMREAVSPEFELMLDAHAWWRMGDRSYSRESVEDLARALRAWRVFWLEEPLPPEDHEAYQKLRSKRLVPLAAGEHELSDDRFLDLIQSRSVDYVQMDVVCQGGYPTGRLVLAEVAREGLRFAFHSWGTALELVAAAHLGICWPELVAEWLEYPCYSDDLLGRPGMYPFPLAEEILTEPLDVQKGQLVVSRKPGLGVEVNEKVLERYRWIPGPWTWFRLTSPPETWYIEADHSVKWSGKQPADT
jgi:L-alanine-DL-glutamate epimerase-like enolase superfamily enzyme